MFIHIDIQGNIRQSFKNRSFFLIQSISNLQICFLCSNIFYNNIYYRNLCFSPHFIWSVSFLTSFHSHCLIFYDNLHVSNTLFLYLYILKIIVNFQELYLYILQLCISKFPLYKASVIFSAHSLVIHLVPLPFILLNVSFNVHSPCRQL